MPGRSSAPWGPVRAALLGGLCTLVVGTALRAAAQEAPLPVNRDARVMAQFDRKVRDYAALHEKLEATLEPLPTNATPEAIDAHQQALARLIGRARARARPGDLFDGEVRALFRRRIAGVLATPAGPGIRAAILDEDPGRIQLSVNGRYPDAVPLSTVPPEILSVLPRLPEQLEYRFISTRLILLDVHARIIADLIDRALPR